MTPEMKTNLDNMLKGAKSIQDFAMQSIEKLKKSMTKEEAEQLQAALNDPAVQKLAKEAAERKLKEVKPD